MKIRKAYIKDLEDIMKVFEIAKEFMKNNGNPTQWINGYPTRQIILDDINSENFYVIQKNNKIIAVFAFIIGEDINYKTIIGNWLNNEEYGTIHRIASDFSQKGVFQKVFQFCLTKIDNIKCDTHKNNLPMQNVLKKYGFKKCGIIYLQNGKERIAFQYKKS